MNPSDPANLDAELSVVWFTALVLACVPVALVVLWRAARLYLSGRAFPLPDGGAMPAVRWPAWFGLLLFGGMYAVMYAVVAAYALLEEAGLLPWGPPDVGEMFQPYVFAAQAIPPALGLAVVAVGFGRGAAATVGVRWGRLAAGVGSALVALAAVLPMCVAGFYVNVAVLDVVGLEAAQHPLLTDVVREPSAWTMGLALLQAGVLAAVSEEFMYRGVLLASLLRAVGPARAIGLTSALFALMHATTEPQAVLPLFLLGLAMGYVAYRRRSLVAPIVVHGLFNTLMVVGAVSAGP